MRPPIYFDNHATTPLDPLVLEAMMPYYTEHFGNAASIQHRYGMIAKEAAGIARKKIAGTINADPKDLVFTSGATESNNLAIKGLCQARRSRGNHIITAATEHRSVLDVFKTMEGEGWNVTYLPVDSKGLVDLESLKRAITGSTILVSIMSANNEIGTIAPVEEIGEICRLAGIIFHTDATQAFGRIPIDVQAMNVHLLSFSAHKVYGPKGIGALYVRSKNPRVAVKAQIDGGGHEDGRRSGTLNVPAVVGFAATAERSCSLMDEEQARIKTLRDQLEEKLLRLGDVTVNGDRTSRLANNLNVTIHGVSADSLMSSLRDIAFSTGSACSSAEQDAGKFSHVLKAIGLSDEEGKSTIRIGLGRFTTDEEINSAARRFGEAVAELRRQSHYHSETIGV